MTIVKARCPKIYHLTIAGDFDDPASTNRLNKKTPTHLKGQAFLRVGLYGNVVI